MNTESTLLRIAYTLHMLSSSISEGRGREKPSSKEGWFFGDGDGWGGGSRGKTNAFAICERFLCLPVHYAHFQNAATSRVKRGLTEFPAFGLSASAISGLFGKRKVCW